MLWVHRIHQQRNDTKGDTGLFRVFYICGPPGMVDAMVVILKSLNIPEKQIKKEQFVGN
jgi:ferredoxin-NADP reductase